MCVCRMHLLETTPSSLPRLLSSVKWGQYKDVAVVSGHVAQLVERALSRVWSVVGLNPTRDPPSPPLPPSPPFPPPLQLQSILLAWRPLQPEDALELLDYAYQDPNVRAYAVRCLKALT